MPKEETSLSTNFICTPLPVYPPVFKNIRNIIHHCMLEGKTKFQSSCFSFIPWLVQISWHSEAAPPLSPLFFVGPLHSSLTQIPEIGWPALASPMLHTRDIIKKANYFSFLLIIYSNSFII